MSNRSLFFFRFWGAGRTAFSVCSLEGLWSPKSTDKKHQETLEDYFLIFSFLHLALSLKKLRCTSSFYKKKKTSKHPRKPTSTIHDPIKPLD